ncbi:RNA-directed DNA polymerase [Enterovibrio sp. FF113]|uniref:RNA-directed DNA polymerase n=1 Tax=Enterovibrio sp. FF113 TaxID=3230010 RepID=UPI00352EC248
MPIKTLSTEFVTLEQLYVAYRKAKQESFYETSNISSIAYSEYEENLEHNLTSLLERLVSAETEWFTDIEFIGGYLYIPKSLDDEKWADGETVHFRSVDPSSDWKKRFQDSRKKLDAEYRLIIRPTIDYQVVSALWILKVGHKLEAKLDKSLAYGNRLRRVYQKNTESYEPNVDSIGLFQPYYSAYKSWRENGLDTMRTLVKKGETVTAITMDLTSFYHNVSPNFLVRPSFLAALDVNLNSDEMTFTRHLVNSINYWYESTPDYQKRSEGALPVGLSASKVISNILLFELDLQISDGLKTAYYGRYVDDIFMVFISNNIDANGNKILSHIRDNVDSLVINQSKDKKPSLRLKLRYAADSHLEFKPEKQKIFSLSSKHGLDLINQISDQIRAQSSEHRLLAEVPSTAGRMAEKALLASSDASLITDALRKADGLSVKRLGFSLLLRDIQTYTSNLSPKNWENTREEFYGLVERYLLTPKGLFDLYGYIPRVFRVVIENQDYEHANRFINKLKECILLIEETTKIKGFNQKKLNLLKEYLSESLIETSIKSASEKKTQRIDLLTECVKKAYEIRGSSSESINENYVTIMSEKLLMADLATRAYKDYWYYSDNKEMPAFNAYNNLSEYSKRVLRLKDIEDFLVLSNKKNAHWKAFSFPTRPLSASEIALTCQDTLKDSSLLKKSIRAIRGARVTSKSDLGYDPSEDIYDVKIPKSMKESVFIALTNFEMTNDQYNGALNNNPDRSIERYESVNRLINSILRSQNKINYVVFPECSLPRKWALNIARKLASNGISLICGIEYHSLQNGFIRNDCLVSLTTYWPGYNTSFLFTQPKILPAHDEKRALDSKKLHLYKPKGHKESLPIYKHGEFHFGIIICSDLTNPANRLHFQGKLDTLFVLAWNKDINTFSFLVDSAAHDIHTYVVQVNNRAYGDSRVRAPYKEAHLRDIVRLKGGVEDYFVVAEIEYINLRKFHNEDNNGIFKPVPIGFTCSSTRKIATTKNEKVTS